MQSCFNPVFGYEPDGNPITKKNYIKSLDKINAEIDNGTAQLFTTDEVKKRIASENGLTY